MLRKNEKKKKLKTEGGLHHNFWIWNQFLKIQETFDFCMCKVLYSFEGNMQLIS